MTAADFEFLKPGLHGPGRDRRPRGDSTNLFCYVVRVRIPAARQVKITVIACLP